MKTRIYLVRHAEAEGNVNRVFHGSTNGQLTEQGHKQAEYVGERFKDIPVDYIYTSNLDRTYSTASYIAEVKELPLFETEELQEIDGGEWEGKLWTELEAIYPEAYYKWENEPHLAKMPEGESMEELQQRILQAIFEIYDRFKGKELVIVTHGTAIRAAMPFFYGMTFEGIKAVSWCDNTAVTTIDVLDDEFKKFDVIEYGSVSHLPKEMRTVENQKWWPDFLKKIEADRAKYMKK